MKILLDTQAFIWLINQDEKLGQSTRTRLYDSSNELKLSYFSVFELTIKASIGKLDYDSSVIDDLPKMGIDLLLPNPKTLEDYKIFNPSNKDPFDNALITLALKEGYSFVTSDIKILNTKVKGLNLLNAKE